MATVWIPVMIRDLTGGREMVDVAGRTVSEVVAALDGRYPGVRSRLCQGESLRPGLAAAVDSQVARLGLAQPVGETSEVHFLPAIAGGSGREKLR